MKTITFRALPFLAALAATACGGPASSTPQAQCAEKAYDDPSVKDLQIRSVSNTNTQAELQPYLKEAIADATKRCLQARGLAAPGGVEREKPAR